MQTHPKWKYHPDKPEGLIVQDVEAEQRLGPGWVDSPNDLIAVESLTTEEPELEAPQSFLADVPGLAPRTRTVTPRKKPGKAAQ